MNEIMTNEILPDRPLKEKTSITLDADVMRQIKILAYEDDRNFSQYVNLILKEWLKQHN